MIKRTLFIFHLSLVSLCYFNMNLNGQDLIQTKIESLFKAPLNSVDSSALLIPSQVEISDNKIIEVFTGGIMDVGNSTALVSGSIKTNSRSSVATFGLCWNTKPNPVVNDNKISIYSDTSNFLYNITGLLSNTVYFIRAYAITVGDTVYGTERYFYTHKLNSIADIEGNHYNTLKIGSQTWIAEDLKTTRFNDGSPIPMVSRADLWGKLLNPAYCWYNNDSVNYSFPRGKLYNWYAVNTGKLCPTGWHVPSDQEWTILKDFLGGDSIAGGKIKTTGTLLWRYPNNRATNETGFSAIPGGYRNSSGVYSYVTIFDNWWSASGIAQEGASYWYVYHATGYFYKSLALRMMGFSVRCLKDQ
jgi:uncharacterized protein (TIGR02145 family)